MIEAIIAAFGAGLLSLLAVEWRLSVYWRKADLAPRQEVGSAFSRAILSDADLVKTIHGKAPTRLNLPRQKRPRKKGGRK